MNRGKEEIKKEGGRWEEGKKEGGERGEVYDIVAYQFCILTCSLHEGSTKHILLCNFATVAGAAGQLRMVYTALATPNQAETALYKSHVHLMFL